MGMFHKKGMTDEQMRRSTDIDCSKDEVRTKQEFAKDCDVNEIIKRCLRAGVSLPGADVQGVFADVSAMPDFAGAQALIVSAREAFDSLDAEVRREFGNDPVKLVEFLTPESLAVPSNRLKAEELGLVVKRDPKDPVDPPAKPAGKKPAKPASKPEGAEGDGE